MNKYGGNKVKKTLVRNFENKKFLGPKQHVVHDMSCSPNLSGENSGPQEYNELSQPSLCSSEALAHYLTDVKKTLQTPNIEKDFEIDKCELGAKVTKKLNFHFNDRIYNNLIELNANIDDTKIKRDKRPITASSKRDLEPNIEDFCHVEKEYDMVPTVPVIKVKLKSIKKVECGQLHKLVSSFEDL